MKLACFTNAKTLENCRMRRSIQPITKNHSRMKKYIITVFSILLFSGALQAQEKWTLEKCINYALENNLSLKSSKLNTESQEIRFQQAKNQRLPSLSAYGSYNLGIGQSKNKFDTYENKNSQSYPAGLNSSIEIFSGFQTQNRIKAQEFTLLASLEDLKKARESMAVNIASAYLQVLYNKELYQVALEQVSLSQTQVTRYESMAALGKIPKGQVFEIQAQMSKDKLNATQSLSTLQLSLLDLSQMLDLAEWSNFDIVIPEINMTSLGIKINPADEVFSYAVVNKASVKASELRLESSKKSLKVTEGAIYPSLSLSANYSNGYYPDSYNPDGSSIGLLDQLDINSRTSVGLNLNIPIFNRFDTRNNIKLSKIDIENAKLEVESTKKALYKDIQQAWFNATTASVKYEATIDAVKNTEEAYRFAEEKFNNGRATIYEFNEAKTKLASVKSDQLQAKYNYLFSVKILDFYKGETLKL